MKSKTIIFTFLLLVNGSVYAQSNDDFNNWQNTLAPLYLWGVSLDGSMNGQNLQVEFSEAVSDLNGIFTFHYEGAKGHWGIIADYSFLNLTPEGSIPIGPGAGQPLNVDMKNTIADVAGLYRFGANNPWQLLAGIRNYELDVDVTVGGNPAVKISETMTDIYVGGRYLNHFGKKWSFLGRADIGSGDSDLVWNMLLAFDYRFNKLLSGFVGYRALDYDVDETNFKYKMNHSGPEAAIAFHW